MIRFIIILVLLGGCLAFIISEILKYFNGISGTRSVAIKDLQELADLVDRFDLEPWEKSEMDLISRVHEVHGKNQMYSYLEYGVFYSIYEEPILAFATKEYDNNDRKIAVVKFNKRKYFFNQHGETVVMTTETGEQIGEVSTRNGLTINMKDLVLHIDADTRTSLIPLSINKKEVIAIATSDDTTGHGGRMIRRINDFDEQREGELILVSIAFALANKQI